jgi:hypothetical protein
MYFSHFSIYLFSLFIRQSSLNFYFFYLFISVLTDLFIIYLFIYLFISVFVIYLFIYLSSSAWLLINIFIYNLLIYLFIYLSFNYRQSLFNVIQVAIYH